MNVTSLLESHTEASLTLSLDFYSLNLDHQSPRQTTFRAPENRLFSNSDPVPLPADDGWMNIADHRKEEGFHPVPNSE